MFQQLTLGGPRLCTVEPCAPAQHSLLDADPPAVPLGVHPAALQTLICVDLELMANSRTRAAPNYLPSSDAQVPARCPGSNAAADARPGLQSHRPPVSWRREWRRRCRCAKPWREAADTSSPAKGVKSGGLNCTALLVHTLGARGVRWFHHLSKKPNHHTAPYAKGPSSPRAPRSARICWP